MPVVITCSACKQQLRVPDNVAGKSIRCPKCQQVFLAQASAAPSEQGVSPQPAAAGPSPAVRPNQGRSDAKADPERPGPLPASHGSRPAPAKSNQLILVLAIGGCVALLAGGGLLAVGLWFFMGRAVVVTDNSQDVKATVTVDPVQPQEKQAEDVGDAGKLAETPKLPDDKKQQDQEKPQQDKINPIKKKKSQNQADDKPAPKQAQEEQGKKKDPPVNTEPALPVELKDGQFVAKAKLGAGDIEDSVKQAWRKVYEIDMVTGKKYTIDLASTEFKAYVILLDPTQFQVAEDFDGSGAKKARIVFTASKNGMHRVHVTSVGRGEGAFTLTIRDDSAAPVAKADDPKAPPSVAKTVRAKDAKTEDGLLLTYTNLPSDKLVGDLIWTAEGDAFFALTKEGVLTRISAPGLIEEHRLNIAKRCSYLALSSEGLVATVADLDEVWVIDPGSLEVKNKIKAPGILRGLSAPTLKIALATGPGGVRVLDLEHGKVATKQVIKVPIKYGRISPDGKLYFTLDESGRLLSYKIEGKDVVFSEMSASIGFDKLKNICISPDSKFVCVPSQNATALARGTFVFQTDYLKKPEFVLPAAGVHSVAFDPVSKKIFTQNLKKQLIVCDMDGKKLKDFDLTAEQGFTDNSLQLVPHPKGRTLLVQMNTAVLLVQPDQLLAADPSAKPADPNDPARHQGEGRTYVQEEGFSIVLPKGWTTSKAPASTFLTAGGAKEDLAPNLAAASIPHDGSKIEDAPAGFKQGFATKFKNWKLIDEGFVMIDGRKAYRLTSTQTVESKGGAVNIKTMIFIIIGNNQKAYVLTFAAIPAIFDQNRMVFEQSALTVRTD